MKVTDPALLAQLNAGPAPASKKVTDPALLAQLNGTSVPEDKTKDEPPPGNPQNLFDPTIAMPGNPFGLHPKALLGLADNVLPTITSAVAGGVGALGNVTARIEQLLRITPSASPEEVESAISKPWTDLKWIGKPGSQVGRDVQAALAAPIHKGIDAAKQSLQNADIAMGTGDKEGGALQAIGSNVGEAARLTGAIAPMVSAATAPTQLVNRAAVKPPEVSPGRVASVFTEDMTPVQRGKTAADLLLSKNIPLKNSQRAEGFLASELESAGRGADALLGPSEATGDQMRAFTRALANEAGVGNKLLTPDTMAKAMDDAVARYDKLHAQAPTLLDTDLKARLQSVADDAESGLVDPNKKAFIKNKIDQILNKSSDLSKEGEAFQAKRLEADRTAKMRSEDAADRATDVKAQAEFEKAKADHAAALSKRSVSTQADLEWANRVEQHKTEVARLKAEHAAEVAKVKKQNKEFGNDLPLPEPPVLPEPPQRLTGGGKPDSVDMGPAAPAAPESAVAKRAAARKAEADQAAEMKLREQEAASVPGAAEPDRVLAGNRFTRFQSELGRLSRTDKDLSPYLRDLSSALDDAFERTNPGEVAASMKDARVKYKRLKQLEAMTTGRPDGVVTPKRANQILSQARNRSEYTYGRGDQSFLDLVRAGMEKLPEKYGDSGTAARGTSAVKLVESVLKPGKALAMTGAGLLGRGIQEGRMNRGTPEWAKKMDMQKPQAGLLLRNPAALIETPEERRKRLLAETLKGSP